MFQQYKTPEEAAKAKKQVQMAMAMGQPGIGGAMASIGSGLMQGNAQRQMDAFAPEMAGAPDLLPPTPGAPPAGPAGPDNPMPWNQNSVPVPLANQHATMERDAMGMMNQTHPNFAQQTAPPAAAPTEPAAPFRGPRPQPPSFNSYRGGSGAPNPLARGRLMNNYQEQMGAWEKLTPRPTVMDLAKQVAALNKQQPGQPAVAAPTKGIFGK